MSFRCLYKWILILLLGSYRARIVHCTSGSGDSPATSTDQTALFSLGSGSTSQDTPSSPPSQSTNLTGSTNATTNDSGASVQAHSSDDEPGLPPALKALAAKCEIITQTGVTFETHKGEDCATSEDDKTLKFDLPGINCVEFKYDGKTLWNHDSDTRSDYPESIKFTSKTVEICYSDSSIKYPLTSEESSTTTETPAEKSEPLSVPSTESPTKIPEALPAPSTETLTDKSENQTSETLPPVTFTVVTAENVYGKNPVQNDATKYDIEEENNILKYKFKHGAYCVELKAGDCSIWTHSLSKEGIELPKIISVNKTNYYVTVRFMNFLTYSYKHKLVDDKSTWVLDEETGLNEFYIGKLKLLTEDDGNGTDAKDLHKTLYEMKCDGDLCYYELKGDSNCSRIDYDGEPVWRYSLSEYGFPKSLFLDVTLKLLMMEFEEVTCAYSLLVDGSALIIPKPDSIATVISVDNLQVMTQDPNDDTVSKINDKTMYEMKTVGGSKPFSKFYFKPKAKCDMVGYKHEIPCGNDECLNKKLRYNYEQIWQHDRELHGDMYPKAVYLITLNSTVVVWFSKDLFHVYNYTKNGWRLELENTSASTDLVELESMEPHDLKNTQTTNPPLLKLMVADDQNGTNLRENDLMAFSARRYFYGYTFKFRRGKFCHEVKYGDKQVWKYDASKHKNHFPTQIDLDAGEPDSDQPEMIRVLLTNDWYYIYEYEKGDFVLKETWEPLVSLSGDDEIVEKRPAEDPSTKRLQHLRSLLKQIPDKSAVVTGVNEPLNILQPKAEQPLTATAPKKGSISVPTPVTPSDIPVGLKILTPNPERTDIHMENDASALEFTRYDSVFECTFKRGVKCLGVMYKDNIVWSSTRFNMGTTHSPTALYFDNGRPPMIKVFFKMDWNYTYKFNGNRWILKSSRTDGMLAASEQMPSQSPVLKYEDLESRVREFLNEYRPVPQAPHMTRMEAIPLKKSPREINVYTFAANGCAVLNIDDETLYQVKAGSAEGNVFKYKFNNGVKCAELKYLGQDVWKHDPNEHGDSYPKEIYYVRDVKILTVLFNSKWFYSYQYINHKFEAIECLKSNDEFKDEMNCGEIKESDEKRSEALEAKQKELDELKKDYEEAQKRLKEIKEALDKKKAELAENRSTSSD